MGPVRPRRPQHRNEHPVARALAALSIALLCFAGLTSRSGSPDLSHTMPLVAAAIPATLSYAGTDAVITGSIDHMFETVGTFVGPNRAQKRDRARIVPDVISVARGFEEVRLRLIAMRAGPPEPTELPQSRIADAELLEQAPAEETPRISVANIDPSRLSALDAIDTAVGGGGDLAPLSPSEQLAYARANTPATTDFGVYRDGVAVSDKELWCLAQAVYFEARGESYRGQVAVAQVVMNRVAHRLYPNTICGVVFQNQTWRNRCQFSFACDGIPEVTSDKKSWAQAQDIARAVAAGDLYLTEVANATHYHATYVYPDWAPRLKKVTKIGLHVFYRFKKA